MRIRPIRVIRVQKIFTLRGNYTNWRGITQTIFAGAFSAVARLWQANDAITSQLMKLFCAGLKKSREPSDPEKQIFEIRFIRCLRLQEM